VNERNSLPFLPRPRRCTFGLGVRTLCGQRFLASITTFTFAAAWSPRTGTCMNSRRQLGHGRRRTRSSPERTPGRHAGRRGGTLRVGVIYALRARACIERGRVWQAEHYVDAVRDHGLSLACLLQGCPRCRRAATTTFRQRRWPDSRLPTSARSSPAALRAALAASIRALMDTGSEARLPHADTVAQRLAELSPAAR